MLTFLKGLDLSKQSLRKFGRTIFVCLFIIGLILFFRHKALFKPAWGLGVLFLTVGEAAPLVLRPVYLCWMGLAFCLGWINTRLIVIVIFYLMVTPIGLLARIFGKCPIEFKQESGRETYWKKAAPQARGLDSYERTF